MAQSINILGLIKESLDQGKYRDEHWEGSFEDYLGLVTDNPLIVRTAHQRVYDMVLSHGVEEVEQDKTQVTHYKFFEDLEDNGVDGLFGLDNSLADLMSTFKAAAHGFGPERRRPIELSVSRSRPSARPSRSLCGQEWRPRSRG